MKISVSQELRKAKSLVKKGELETARGIYQKILKTFPNNKKAAEGLTALGDPANHVQKHPPQEVMNQLIGAYNQGQLEAALNQAMTLTKEFPDGFLIWNILGATSQQLGRNSDAIFAFQKVIQLNPEYADGYNNLGTVLKKEGQHSEAIRAYDKAIEKNPEYAEAFNNLGNAYQDLGKYDQSITEFNKAIAIKSDYAEAFNNMGNSLKDLRQHVQAIEAYEEAIKLKPDYANAFFNKGNAHHEQGNLEQAIENYQQAIKIKPDYPEAFNNIGNALQDAGKPEQAREAYEKAIAIKPDYAMSLQHLSVLKTFVSDDPQIQQLEQLMTNQALNDADNCHLSYALAKAHEDLGHWEEAFNYLRTGGALRKKLLNYNIKQDEKLFISIKETAKAIDQQAFKPKADSSQNTPIFILGMPRSGTTLIEQIISCHSEVTGAGELDFLSELGSDIILGKTIANTNALENVRDQYLREIETLSKGCRLVTDKQPQNFLYISLIRAVFPDAKIIHVTRQAAATCWSNFRNYFSSDGLGYSYELEDVVSYYRLYQDLMNYWDQLHGELIYHADYDQLTVNQEIETKNLIDYLDLEWEPACLSPHENQRIVQTASQQQVRRKVYTGSSEEWRKFEPFLGGTFDELP